jgi:hypothetical protein
VGKLIRESGGVRASSAFVLGGGGGGVRSGLGTVRLGRQEQRHSFGNHLRSSWAAEAAAFGPGQRSGIICVEAAAFGPGHRSSWAAAAFGFPGDTPVKNMKRVREYEELSGEPRVFCL